MIVSLFGFIFVGKKIIFLWLSNGVQEFHLDKATLQLQLPERSEKRVAYWHVLCMERNSLSLFLNSKESPRCVSIGFSRDVVLPVASV